MISLRNDGAAATVHRHLATTATASARHTEKLSSGLRIVRAGDDAAGLAASEALRSQASGSRVAARGLQDAVSVVQTAEGALGEATGVLQRMRDLTLQSLNRGAHTSASLLALDAEFSALTEHLTALGAGTSFADRRLLDGRATAGTTALTAGTSVLHSERTVDAIVVGPGRDTVSLQLDDRPPLVVVLPHGSYDRGNKVVLDDAFRDQIAASPYADELAVRVFGFPEPDSPSMHAHVDVAPGLAHRDLVLADGGSGLLDALTLPAGTTALEQQDASRVRRQELVFQSGAHDGEIVRVTVRRLADLVAGATAADLWHGPHDALRAVDDALDAVADERAHLGAQQNALEHAVAALERTAEDTSAAESRIRDADVGLEVAGQARSQILRQAAEAVLVQANQRPSSVLELLKAA